MAYSIKDKIAKLVDDVANIQVIRAIGQTGDINFIPKAGEGDIDIFVFGDKVPTYEERKVVYDNNSVLFEECYMNVCEGGVWGTGDIFIIDGVETMLMYFSTNEILKYINEILDGKHLNNNDGFYPIGRCATLKTINVIYDELRTLECIKEKLSTYPDKLRKEMIDFHIGKINNKEDFGRALLRKDVLFYHQVLEVSIDHYLQGLYAANKTYYPSRKRTKQYIDSFEIKPENCYERLLKVIKFGSTPEDIEKSYSEWCGLVSDLEGVCNKETA